MPMISPESSRNGNLVEDSHTSSPSAERSDSSFPIRGCPVSINSNSSERISVADSSPTKSRSVLPIR